MSITLTPIASDSFNRANENPLNSTNWGPHIFADLEIVSDQCVPSTTSTSCGDVFKTSAPNDQYAQFTIAALPSSGANDVFLILRYSSGNYYTLGLGPSNSLFIQTHGSSNLTLLNTTVSRNIGDVFVFAVIGTTLYVLQNGTQVASITDSTYSSGLTGIMLQAAVTNTDVGVTNFVMGSAAQGTPGSPFLGGVLVVSAPAGNPSGLPFLGKVHVVTAPANDPTAYPFLGSVVSGSAPANDPTGYPDLGAVVVLGSPPAGNPTGYPFLGTVEEV